MRGQEIERALDLLSPACVCGHAEDDHAYPWLENAVDGARCTLCEADVAEHVFEEAG